MADNIYVLWANRLKSGAADGILAETDQIYNNTHIGILDFLDKDKPWVDPTYVDVLNSYIQNEATTTGLSASFISQRSDIQSLILASSVYSGFNVLSSQIDEHSKSCKLQIMALDSKLLNKVTGLEYADRSFSSQMTAFESKLSSFESELSSQITALNKSDSELSNQITDLDEIKHGDSFYDIETQYIYFFQNASDRAAWCINRDINSDLIMKKQKINHEFKTTLNDSSITLENYTGNTIAQLPAATQNSAGLMTSKDKVKLTELQDSIENKQEKMTIEPITISDYDPNYTIKKNSILKVTNDLTDELKISFEPTTIHDFGKFTQHGLYFSTGNNITNVSLHTPANIKWANENIISIEKNSTYEIIFTTHDNGSTYTAIWTRYKHITDIDNKPYFTTEFTTTGSVYLQRGYDKKKSDGTTYIPGGKAYGDPSGTYTEECPYYSKYNKSNSSWGNWTLLTVGAKLDLSAGDIVRWKWNNKSNYNYRSNEITQWSLLPGEMTGGCIVIRDPGANYVPVHSYSGGVLWYRFVFGSGSKVKLSGNILSLLYGDNFIGKENDFLPDGAFQNMFRYSDVSGQNNYNHQAIISAKDLILPSKHLSIGAYYAMFSGCAALTDMPQILAETAHSYSCSNMFTSCKSLTDTTELKIKDFSGITASGTNGGTMCACEGMFYGCSELKNAVIPPATKLSYGTYYQMFAECTKLEYIHDIPATEVLASKMYGQGPYEHSFSMGKMFYHCTSLNKINGSLKIKNPGGGCYSSMFSKCTNLKVAPEILATTMTTNCFSRMFDGCTSLIVPPPYLPKEITTKDGYTRAGYACEYMFNGCTSLEYGPMLPAEEPIINLYNRMFYDCTALKSIPYIGLYKLTKTNANGCCGYMFHNCNALQHVELTKNVMLSGTDSSQIGGNTFNSIFSGARNLKSIRLCYDPIGATNAKDTVDILRLILGDSWCTFYPEDAATTRGGILYIPKSLKEKVNTQYADWKYFLKNNMAIVPSSWDIVYE